MAIVVSSSAVSPIASDRHVSCWTYWLLENSALVQAFRRGTLPLIERIEAVAEPSRKSGNAGQVGSEPARSLPPEQRLGTALLARTKAWCDSHRLDCLVLTTGMPALSRYPWLGEEARALGIDFVDLSPSVSPVFNERPSEVTIPEDRHPNEEGALVIADSVWPFLRDRVAALLAKR